MSETVINVPGRFNPIEYGTPLANASDIYDENNEKSVQETLDDENNKIALQDTKIGVLNTAGTLVETLDGSLSIHYNIGDIFYKIQSSKGNEVKHYYVAKVDGFAGDNINDTNKFEDAGTSSVNALNVKTSIIKDALKGDDAYKVYVNQWIEDHPGLEPTPENGFLEQDEWLVSLKGEQGNDGADAVNPFKGYFNSLSELQAKHTIGEVGDFANVYDSQEDKTFRYIWDITLVTPDWAQALDSNNQPIEVTPSTATFSTGEQVVDVPIDDTHLTNPANGSIAKAEDVDNLLNELIDYEHTTEEVSKLIPYVQHQGYFLVNGTITNTSGNDTRRYSDPIFLKAGETLKIKAITPNNIGRYGIYNPDTETISGVVLGTSEAATSGNEYETTYVATGDTWLVIGWTWGYFQMTLTKTYNKTTTSSKLDDIDEIEETLELEDASGTVTETIQLSTTEGAFYNAGVYSPLVTQSNSNYSYSAPFNFYKGDTITIVTKNCSSSAILFAIKDGDWFRKVVAGNNSEQTFVYEAVFDGQGEVSFLTARGITVTRTYSKSGKSSERLDNIESQLSSVAATTESFDGRIGAVEQSVFSVIEDNLTENYVDGYFIRKTGERSSNQDFGYKEFNVRAGSVIEYSASYGNTNVATLAKKLDIPVSPTILYEMLVQGSDYTSQSFTYTVPEDMTIAISFYKSLTRSLKITTDFINANSLGVTNLINDNKTQHDELIVQDIDFGFMFNKIAVIGDSLASGRVEGIVGQPDAVGADYLGFSWLTFLAKRWRCTKSKNYSNAGATTASWITTWLPQLQDDTEVYDAYFIALGTNNEYNETDPTGDTSNYQGFIDRYNDIIDAVRTKAPNAAIFIMSLYEQRSGVGNSTLEEIAEDRMATDDGIFYLDYAHEAEYKRYSPEVNWRGHFSSDGYVYVASAISRILNNIVWDNKTAEFWQQFAKHHNVNPS